MINDLVVLLLQNAFIWYNFAIEITELLSLVIICGRFSGF